MLTRSAVIALPVRLSVCPTLTDPDSTILLHKSWALRSTITFSLAATDGPHMNNMETAGKVKKQSVEFMTISSQRLVLRDGTTLWWLYDHYEHILRRCLMPCGVQNEDITHMHKSFTLYSHNVPTCTLQQHSISSTYILKYRMETEIKLNKTLGAVAGLV